MFPISYTYDELDRDDLIKIILTQDNYINTLEEEIRQLKEEKTDKINSEFEQNKRFVSKFLTNLMEGVINESQNIRYNRR